MKVGDKVLCKSWFPFVDTFIQGNYYVIDSIVGNNVSIIDEFGDPFFLCFNVDNVIPGIKMERYGDYFVTVKELRQQKLDKINENC